MPKKLSSRTKPSPQEAVSEKSKPTKNAPKIPWNLIPTPSSNPFVIFDYEMTRYLLHSYSNTIPQTVTAYNRFTKNMFTGFWKLLSLSNNTLLYMILFPVLYWMSEKDVRQYLNYLTILPDSFIDQIVELFRPAFIKYFYLTIAIDFLLITSLKTRIKRLIPLRNNWFLHPKTYPKTDDVSEAQRRKKKNQVYSMPSGNASRAIIVTAFVIIWAVYNVNRAGLDLNVLLFILGVLMWSLFVSVSNVCLGMCFIGDVFVGWIIGAIEVYMAYWIKETWKLFSEQ